MPSPSICSTRTLWHLPACLQRVAKFSGGSEAPGVDPQSTHGAATNPMGTVRTARGHLGVEGVWLCADLAQLLALTKIGARPRCPAQWAQSLSLYLTYTSHTS
jgi:hypothetical protein